MNFFEQQDKTKKTTKKLIVLFSISVFALGCLNYLIVQFYLSTSKSYSSVSYVGEPGVHGHQEMHFTLWDPKVFVLTVGITLLVILVVSIIKGLSLRDGGQSVAEMMGGIRIAHDTTNLNEKKLLNVVEEMALASGIPVPDVYILEENGINAFAAGHSIDDAVIGVTRGCIEKLNREELQGVVAHEFSHIFHGDMNINLYLISLLHGILFLHFVGRFLVRSSGSSRRSRNNQGGAIVIGGLVLMVVGYVGYFFGRMIQSAISRQREYLADASAVQYTRNPHGISRALAKIGGFFHPSESHSILQNN
ncbi:MAG: M48 family metallopeptidase, partial [Bdellovibrionales bacterium]|nr:M48 family metallopeptidase [Bdellovibrionales bacterium]